MPIQNLNISGMSCGHCVSAVKSALEGVDGVGIENVSVGSARISVQNEAQLQSAIAAITEEGYKASLADASTSGAAS